MLTSNERAIQPHPRLIELVRRTVAAAHSADPAYMGDGGTVPVSHYTDAERCAREVQALFERLPIPIAASAELAGAGSTIVRDLAGVSLLIVRDADGVVRAHRNACRHRATRLLREDCKAKAFVCPYHGWTYALDGALRHVPRIAAFPSLDVEAHGLAQARAEERHGLVWVTLGAGPDVATHLGVIDEEVARLAFADHVVARRVVREQRGNWKLLMEAFLEGYHLRTLHRSSIYPFFLDACSLADRAGPHVRHASARRTALEVKDDAAFAARPMRELATFGYMIFPATVLIAHPDWTSHVVVQPLGPDRFLWSHTQLVPGPIESDAVRSHFERSFDLIEGSVFGKEDLFAVAETQSGLASGANERLTFGRLEAPILWFHDAVRDALRASTP